MIGSRRPAVSEDRLFSSDFREKPYWWEAAPPTTDGSSSLPRATVVAVVGGGYAGLSAALELARNGVEATVLEANRFGEGASTRNGGAVSSGVSLGRGLSGARAADANAMLTDAAQAFSHLESVIRQEGIACEWQRSGRFIGAFTRRHLERMQSQADSLNRVSDAGAVIVPEERQQEEIASSYYRGGMTIERSGKLHPALLHRGLLLASRRAGATLCAETEVTNIEGEAGAFRLHTSRGSLNARDVIIATNGYSGPLVPALRRRIVPVASHIIATEELPQETIQSLMPKGRTISDTKRVLCYYRQSPDGRRLIFGGRARFTAVSSAVSAPVLYGYMTERFPQLAGVRITHAWTGNVAFTFDFLPHLGRLDGLYYCLGCNGSGIAMMTWLGHEVARKIAGGLAQANSFDDRPFPTRPLYSGTPWFLPFVGSWYRFRDRLDRWRD